MISVIVITKNEEKMIKGCLESVKWADEIIIADNGSTDNTLDLAKKYTDKIFEYDDLDFASLRNKAMEKATGDWVLYVDADERILEPLREEILKLVLQATLSEQTDDYSAYAISRRNVILGHVVNYEPYKNDWMTRLFKRSDFESWTGKVHESSHFKGKRGYTKNSLIHLTHRNIDQIVLKSLAWSKIDAKLRLDAKHPKMTTWRFFRILISETFVQGIMKRGFFNGEVGVIDSILQVFSLFMTYVRLWEMQQTKPLDQVYEDIDKKLLENGFKF